MTAVDPKTFKIGDVIYYIAPNGYSGRFERRKIAGETSRSWLLLSVTQGDDDWMLDNIERFATKLPKHAKGYTFGTPQAAALLNWATTNKHKIAHEVEWGSPETHITPDLLLQIAKLIGFTPLPEENNGG